MSQKSPAPLALEWLCFLRDRGQDLKVTLGERALASLLPTYGQGKDIYVSTAKLAKITGWSENTVRKHRNGLIAKGLLEDITGDPDKQLRTYRLTMPGYFEPPQILRPSPANVEGVPPQNLTPSPAESEPNIKLVDQEKRSSPTSSQPDGDGQHASLELQSQTQGPAGPGQAPGDGSGGSLDDGPSFDWDDPGDGEYVAEWLGVPLASIGQPFRSWFVGYVAASGFDIYAEADSEAFYAAAYKARDARNPVGYFQAIFPGMIEQHRAKAAACAADAEATDAEAAALKAREEDAATELESLRLRYLTAQSHVPEDMANRRFEGKVKEIRHKDAVRTEYGFRDRTVAEALGDIRAGVERLEAKRASSIT
jgi:hypothetical protein